MYPAANDMVPGEPPSCLQGLTQLEEMLNPIMCVYRKHGGQRGYRGHVLSLPQDIQGFIDQLSDLPVLLVRRTSDDNTHADFRVRREKVLHALQWLKQNNPFYSDMIQLLNTQTQMKLLKVC